MPFWPFFRFTVLFLRFFHYNFLFKNGRYGVQLFFLISAITLCHSMASRHIGGGVHLLNFYLRRLFRIAPLYWLSMVFYWSVPASLSLGTPARWAPEGVQTSYFVLNALFLHGWYPYSFNSIVPGGWSIAVEMAFYLVFPFCFYYITNLRRATLWLLGGIFFTIVEMYLFGKLHTHIWPKIQEDYIVIFFATFWFPSQIAVFLMGIFTYFLLQEPIVKTLAQSRFGACSLAAFCLMFLVIVWKGNLNDFFPTHLVIVMLLAGIVISLSGNRVPYAVNFLICHLGKLSYSCYLTHFAALAIVLASLKKLLASHLLAQGGMTLDTGHSLLNVLLFALIVVSTLGLTVLFSTITHHLIENPGIALGRQLIRRLHARD